MVPRKGSLRGALVTRGTAPRVIAYESNLERKVLLVLLARPDVAEVREQIAPVAYQDEAGAWRSHRFDFLVHGRDGRRVLVAVKPRDLAERHDLAVLLARIAGFVPRSLADTVRLMTEDDVPRDRVYNAKLFHCVRDDGLPEHDGHVERIARTLVGATTVSCLVAASGLDGEGFRAIVRLIDRGTLRVVGHGRIGYGTTVTLASGTGGAQ